MVRCVGLDEGDEPFTLSVHANALLVADFHAHLSDSEIIGFLGGHWDAATRRTCSRGQHSEWSHSPCQAWW